MPPRTAELLGKLIWITGLVVFLSVFAYSLPFVGFVFGMESLGDLAQDSSGNRWFVMYGTRVPADWFGWYLAGMLYMIIWGKLGHLAIMVGIKIEDDVRGNTGQPKRRGIFRIIRPSEN